MIGRRRRGSCPSSKRRSPRNIGRTRSDTYLDLESVTLLGEGRWEESLEKQRQRDFEDCVLCRYIPMAILFDSLGVRDSAIVYYERYVES